MTRILLVCCCLIAVLSHGNAEDSATTEINASSVARIAVLHDGRVKPWDTFARSILLNVHSKQKANGVAATEWLFRALADPVSAREQKVFTIRSPAVLDAVGVKPEKNHRYSLDQLKDAFVAHEPLIQALMERDGKMLDQTEQQLIQNYNKIRFYLSLIHSSSCFWQDIRIDKPELAQKFGVEAGTSVSYYFFAARRDTLREVLLHSAKQKEADPAFDDQNLARIWRVLEKRPMEESANNLQIIPEQDGQWISPWDVLSKSDLSESDRNHMDALDDVFAAWSHGNQEAFDSAVERYRSTVAVFDRIGLEVFYNKADFFYMSLYFYIAAFLCLLMFGVARKRGWYKAGFILLLIGGLLHVAGLSLRMYIMARPPVSTLYESVIFAGLISVLFGIAVEHYRRDSFGMLGACIAGICLQFIGFSYAAEGDTMGMLQAVLNSVFWLATHVVSITIGYGCAMLAGLFGHIILARNIWMPQEKKKNAELFKTARGIALVALFFTTLGTILGGIWADQSWGRFWGWDPKENGAMLIVLWLLICIHGVIAGELKQIGFAMLLSLTNICVALAWFGVNLLSVGLHSYGHDDGTALALLAFCLLELLLVIPAAFVATRKQKMSTDTQIPSG